MKTLVLRKVKIGRWFRYYFPNGISYYTEKQVNTMRKRGQTIQILSKES